MKHLKLVIAFVTFGAVFDIGAALAADLPVKATPYTPPPVFSWTGFYVGGQGGGGWLANQVTNGPNATDGTANFPPGFVHHTVDGSGGLGGVYGGYNYQFGQFVVGIDGDYSWADLTGSTSDIGPTGFTNVSHESVKWIGTVTGRLGYAANDWLFFGKGGWAWSGFDGTSSTFNTAGALTNVDTNSQTRNGWTLGAGAEWAFAAHWSAKLEYDYVKFDTAYYNNTATTVAGVVSFPGRSATANLNIVKAGVAYRF